MGGSIHLWHGIDKIKESSFVKIHNNHVYCNKSKYREDCVRCRFQMLNFFTDFPLLKLPQLDGYEVLID